MESMNPTEPPGWSEETSRLFLNYSRYFVPERELQMRMIASLLSALDGPTLILDLCCGEGLLDELILDTFPAVSIQGLDGSAEMLQQAGKRLRRFNSRFCSEKFDLAGKGWRNRARRPDAVVSSLAIHHLMGEQKLTLFVDIFGMLAEKGLFIIADVIEHPDETGRRLAAEALDESVRKISLELDGNTNAFDFFQREGWNIFRHLDPEDIDKPSPLFDQLKWLEQAGFAHIDVHWMLAGHAIFSASK
jgi:SAM-dependent methyltransferase